MFGWENLQSLTGVALAMAVCWAVSENRRRFPWKLAIGSILVQLALILVLFGLPQSRGVVQALNGGVDALGQATQQGVQFVFGFLGGGAQPYQVVNPGALFIFAFDVLPLIIVVSTLSALLWHWGVLKWVMRGFGVVFQKTLGLGGASAFSSATNIFLGNVECALVIKGYLPKLTRSELFLMITLGMATMAGSTMVAYATILHQAVPNAAAHVIAASIISAPAGILLARILVPEKPEHLEQAVDYNSLLKYSSTIDAIGTGVSDGLHIALNVGATLIAFVSLIAIANSLLGLLPHAGAAALTVQRVLGWVFSPLAWTLGVPWKEAARAGDLLGVKLVLTELIAIVDLSKEPELTARTRIIMTYALCSFANIGSVGIIASGFGVLMPDRRQEILGMMWKGLLGGFLATIMTGALIGALPGRLFGV
ncbi:MAG: NupC/NupG family nucleoside CNT transporter [Caulobacteraceae bacterium]